VGSPQQQRVDEAAHAGMVRAMIVYCPQMEAFAQTGD
jgi:hypothetical protein